MRRRVTLKKLKPGGTSKRSCSSYEGRTSARPAERTAQSQSVGLERVATSKLSRIEPIEEPAFALRRSTMGKRVGNDVALHLFLQAVVADRGRGLQSLIEIALVEEIEAVLQLMRGPHVS